MSIENIILWIVFGAIAGWLAGKLMGNGGGLVRNIILGIVGSFVGGFVAGQLGLDITTGFSLVGLLVAVGGACLVIFLGRLLVK
ncbi:MAG: GlsB/YeaQ/YmgE family stress response membrane protein [Christensenellales bacterium]